jgi:hypothetical protein
MLACRDCLYYRPFYLERKFSKCASPNNPVVFNPITGEYSAEVVFCSINRQNLVYTKTCREDARWFKPKTSKLRWLKYFFTDK